MRSSAPKTIYEYWIKLSIEKINPDIAILKMWHLGYGSQVSGKPM